MVDVVADPFVTRSHGDTENEAAGNNPLDVLPPPSVSACLCENTCSRACRSVSWCGERGGSQQWLTSWQTPLSHGATETRRMRQRGTIPWIFFHRPLCLRASVRTPAAGPAVQFLGVVTRREPAVVDAVADPFVSRSHGDAENEAAGNNPLDILPPPSVSPCLCENTCSRACRSVSWCGDAAGASSG